MRDELRAIEYLGIEYVYLDLLGLKVSNPKQSSVAYLIGITDCEPNRRPIGLDLEIVGNDFPDFDNDLPQSKRIGVRDYLVRKYGESRVCSIGTLSRLSPKSGLKDIAKVQGIPFQEANKMTKILDKALAIDTGNEDLTWDEVMEEAGPDLLPWILKYPELFSTVESMTGLIRQAGTHAAGVVISDIDLIGSLPTRTKGDDPMPISQFTMGEVEKLGFLKTDLLGIRHLDTLMEAQEMVQGVIDPEWFYAFTPEQRADPDIWDDVSKGKTLGLHTLESGGMTAVALDYKPTSFAECAILTAINRPGVVRTGALKHFINRRNGKETVSYLHPLTEPILEGTEGYIIYQEQILRILVAVAGYTLDDAERIRKYALDISTPLLTTDGWSTIGDVKIGQYVFSPVGTPVEIIDTTEIFYDNDCYELEWSDGVKTIADADHMWSVVSHSERRKVDYHKKRTGSSYTPKAELLDTKTIFQTQKTSAGYSNWAIPQHEPLQWPEAQDNFTIDPWLLGMWLGDGTTNAALITTADQETVDRIVSLGYDVTHQLPYAYSVHPGLRTSLRLMGLLGNKHIPQSYMNGSFESRLNLLRGIMDADGWVQGSAVCITQKSLRLIRDMVELLRSLGEVVSIHNPKMVGEYGPYTTISWTPVLNPFSLQRKSERVVFKQYNYRYLRNVIKVESVPVKCITVASEDHLFLVGDNLITTHNCGKKMQVEMRQERPLFVERCLANSAYMKGCKGKDPLKTADALWTMMEEAGSYLFGLGHATAYAYLPMWGAHMKRYYPREYLTALLKTDAENKSRYLSEARALDVAVLPPDINDSEEHFTLTAEGIRYGLSDIRGLGPTAVAEVIALQPYSGLEDYLERTTGRGGRKKTVVASLISVGAFDKFGERSELLRQFYATRKDCKDEVIPDFTSKAEVIKLETTLIGDCITFNPLEDYRSFIENECLRSEDEIKRLTKGSQASMGGKLVKLRTHQAKNGTMAFVSIEYDGVTLEAVCFANAWGTLQNFAELGAPVILDVERLDKGVCINGLERLDWI